MRHKLLLLTVSSLLAACRPSTTDTQDMSNSNIEDLSDVVDLSQPKTVVPTTIRYLNSVQDTIKVGDRVRVTGVVTSPLRWVSADTNAGYCYYRLHVAQVEPAPATLQDGMVLILSLKMSNWADGSTLTQCKDRGKNDPVATAMDAATAGQQVEIEGTFDTRTNCGAKTRQINLFGGKLTSQGMAVTMPTPVDVDPTQYPVATGSPAVLSQKFVDGHAALVRFSNVKSYGRSTQYQDFSVSPTGAAPGALIATNYLRATGSYTSLPDGTTYKTVVGVLLGDFCGTVWPRTTADLTQ